MRLPIQYSFSFPERICNDFPRLNFADFPTLTFSAPDTKIFRNLALAYEALQRGGNLACILNAANEIVVEAFLQGKIAFPDMWRINEQVMQKSTFIARPTLDDYMATDLEARAYASGMVSILQLKN